MDKQKQIEDIADILCQSKNYKCDGEDCKCIKQATDLYNADYRNCKDKVVLTREEYDEFRKDQAEVKFLKKQIIEQASKETAREILKSMFDGEIGGKYDCKVISIEKFNEFAKQYGVIGEENGN